MQCKVDAVQAFTQPTTKKQVRAFTGYVDTTEDSSQHFPQSQHL